MKNTNGNYRITKKKLFNKFVIIGGIAVSSFFMNDFAHACTTDAPGQYVSQIGADIVFGDEDYEDELYQRAVEELKGTQFDLDFVELCNRPVFVVDGVEYKAKEFIIRLLEDGTAYITTLKNPKVNILTGEEVEGKVVLSMSLYKTSIYYQMYVDGVITDKNIVVDKEIFKKYADNWDGKMHDQTFDNAVTVKMNEYIDESKGVRENGR